MIATEKSSGPNSIEWYLWSQLDSKKYALDVKKDTVSAKEVSYEFDVVSVVHRFVGKYCHCHEL